MDWLHIFQQIFDTCLVPLLGIATAALVVFIKKKIAEGQEKTKSELADRYLALLENTIVDCIKATNQTYVNALKDKNAFDAEAQKQALNLTSQAVINILSEDAKKYLNNFVGDLDLFVKEKIEAKIKEVKP